MESRYYEIYIKNYNKTLIFCKKEDYKGYTDFDTKTTFFTNIYIYEDDTVTEVINKIKIGMIDLFNDYNPIDFEKICGFLSASWNYYSEYKIYEYIKYESSNLENINKKSLIQTITNIHEHVDSINENELVIGFFNRNKNKNYTYYVSPSFFKKIINSNIVLENEYNKPINSYKNYTIEKDATVITKFNFELIDNEMFKLYNNYKVFGSIQSETLNDYDVLKSTYINIDNIKTAIDTDITEYNIDKIINESVNKLCLEIYGDNNIDLIDFFDTINLTERFPLCILSYKQKIKNENYKILKNKNGIPVINIDTLNNIIQNKVKHKDINYLLIKYKFKHSYYDIYLIENNYFNIKFNFQNDNVTSITWIEIITEINNVLGDLNLRVGNKNKILNMNEFRYYNNNGYIKFNDRLDTICNQSHFMINLSKYLNESIYNLSSSFLYYTLLNNTEYNISPEFENINIIYHKNKEKIQDNIKYIVEENGINVIYLNTVNEPIEDFSKVRLNTNNITLFYNKSGNSNSYNYMIKFFKHIMTFEEQYQRMLLKCDFNETSVKKIKEFLYNYEIDNVGQDTNIEYIYDNINKSDKKYCNEILYNTNRKTELNIDIFINQLNIKVSNYSTITELINIKNSFINFIKFIKRKQEENILLLHSNLYHKYGTDLDNVYNIYYNIYNLYNKQHNININEYYLYLYYKEIELYNIDKLEKSKKQTKNIVVRETIKLSDDTDDTDESISNISDIQSDEYIEDVSSSSDDTNTYSYNDNKEYKIKHNNSKNKNTLFKQGYNELCKLEKRPSILTKSVVEELQKLEQSGNIKINGKKTDIFTNLINLNENIVNIEINQNNIILDDVSVANLSLMNKTLEEKKIEKRLNKTKLGFSKGREYIINITYNKDDTFKKKVILAEKPYISTSDNISFYKNNILDVNENYLIENIETYKLSYNEYISSNEEEFRILLNYEQTIYNDDYCISLCLLDIGNIQLLTNIVDTKGNKYTFYSNNNPRSYYYNKKLYGDKYFVCLPGESHSSQQLNDSSYAPNYIVDGTDGICCIKKDKHRLNTIDDNYKKKPSNIQLHQSDIQYKEEKDYKLKHLKLGKIPREIYKNIILFLKLKNVDITNDQDVLKIQDEYNRLELVNGHMYRIGVIEDTHISSFILSILYTVKYENIKSSLNLSFIETEKYFTIHSIKNMFKEYIYSLDINNLISLNDGIYYKLPNNIIQTYKMVDFTKDVKEQQIHSIEREQLIKEGLYKYIEENLEYLDMYLIWDMLCNIFELNIIIIELLYNNSLYSSIKCPNINKNSNFIKKTYKNYCILLKFKNIYQPLVTYNEKNNKKFSIVFNIENTYNLDLLYNKCLLKYNTEQYNNVIVNSLYNNLDIHNYILLDDEDLHDLINSNITIKYVINIHFTKIGLLLSYKDLDDLFIPLNYIKHNINYQSNINNINIKYVWFDNIEKNNIIQDYETIKQLIHKYFIIHNNHKLNLNNKYITNIIDTQTYIIGIGININEYIPIEKILLTDVELDEMTILEGYIDYKLSIDTSQSIIKDLKNSNINISIFYHNFIIFISTIISRNSEFIRRIDTLANTQDKPTLKQYLLDIFKSHIIIVDNDKMDVIQDNNYNYYINNTTENNEFKLTNELYQLFIDYIVYDLIYNHYRKNQILNNMFSKNIILDNKQNSIILDSKYIDNETIFQLYNNEVSHYFYDKVGKQYEKNITVYNNNVTYCNNITEIYDDENNQYKIYNFKSLLKTSDIYYSNCIYYNIGKYILKSPKDYINTTRLVIADKIKKDIDNKYFIYNNTKYPSDLQALVKLYRDLSNTHLYNNINNSDDFKNVLISDLHWITELDLAILANLNNIIFKVMYASNNDIIDQYTIIGDESKSNDIYYLYSRQFYYKKIYYYMEKV